MAAPPPVSPTAADDAPLLAADVGTAYTKVYLLEDVDGERRLLSVGRCPTLGEDGLPAVSEALGRATAQALDVAGRSYTPDQLQRLVLTSAGASPRVAVLATRAEDAQAVAEALAAIPVRVTEPLLLDTNGIDWESVLAQLEGQAPDVVVVVAGGREPDQRAAEAAVEVISRALSERAPLLVLAGDEASASRASGLAGDVPLLLATGEISQAVEGALRAGAARRLGGGWLQPESVQEWTVQGALASTHEGICAATELIAERYDVDVLTLDLGASHALAVAAVGTGGKRRVSVVARADLGLHAGRRTILREAGVDNVVRWLPIDVDAEALARDARRRLLLPASVPETVEELLTEHAYAREALRLLTEEVAGKIAAPSQSGRAVPPLDLLIGSGGVLANVPRLMQAVLMLLDAVQPEALTQLALDRATALPLIGQMAISQGATALGAALERDGLLNLGLCIAPVGVGREGELAIKVEVVYSDRSPATVEVPYGAIEVVPLPIGERASLKLWPTRDFDVGLGRGGAATPRAEVEGGAVGIIVDARGRPLAIPDTASKRQAKLLQWLQSTRAYPPLSFVQARRAVEGETA